MKIRNIPFGYVVEKGEIIPHEKEAQVVKQVFSYYLQGTSLQAVADVMDMPYSAASPDWNKHKVKRILDNPRYTGTNGYPALVSPDDYYTVQSLKIKKNTCIPSLKTSEIELIRSYTYCGVCGNRLHRKIHSYGERWRCRSECESIISLRDSDLLQVVTDALNAVINNTDMLRTASSPRCDSLAVTKQQNEINRALGNPNADADSIRKRLFVLAGEKYATCGDDSQPTLMLRGIFNTQSTISQFDSTLFVKTVDKVFISKDGTASLLLKNGQTLPESHNYERSYTYANDNAGAG